MAKIKPLRKKRRFLRWLKRLLDIQSPSARACGQALDWDWEGVRA